MPNIIRSPRFWLVVAVLVIVLVVGIVIYRKHKDDGATDEEEEVSEAKVDKSNLTIAERDAEDIAMQLGNAMDDWGTDTDAIFSLLKDKSPDDLKLIFNKFGMQKYVFGGARNTVSQKLIGVPKNLLEWFHEELSGNDLDQIKKIFSPTKLPIPF